MINAIRLTEELEKVGFTPEQAKKSVDTWMSLINDNFATKSDFREFQLVSKSDLREVQINLQEQIKDLRSDLEGQIKDLRSDLEGQIKDLHSKIDQTYSKLVIRLGGIIVITATIMTSIIALLIKS